MHTKINDRENDMIEFIITETATIAAHMTLVQKIPLDDVLTFIEENLEFQGANELDPCAYLLTIKEYVEILKSMKHNEFSGEV